jgi:nitrate/nitrite transport system substrate-binding protein
VCSWSARRRSCGTLLVDGVAIIAPRPDILTRESSAARTDNVRESRARHAASRRHARRPSTIRVEKQLDSESLRIVQASWYASCKGPEHHNEEVAVMTAFKNPFDSSVKLDTTCGCGGHASEPEHALDRSEAEHAPDGSAAEHALHRSAAKHAPERREAPHALRAENVDDDETLASRAVETAVMRALFPHDATRRRFIQAVGSSTAIAAVSSLFPLAAAKDAFAQSGRIEKPNLKVGFIPITCATPIIMSQPMGYYGRQGLNVDVVKTAGWAVIRDKTINKEYDAAHMLSPMPLAITLGVGAKPLPYTMPAVENINGQAITLAMKHKDKRDPKQWKGFKFAVPFDYSMHNYLLRYFVAEHGLDPDRDIQIRAVPPPEMVANLRADNIDGFLAPDPVNQRAVYDGVGFIHILSKEIWDGHPCCAFAASREFVTQYPGTYRALLKAILDATAFAAKPENRKQIAEAIAPANYLNQPVTVVEQVLTGTYADGLGNVRKEPKRIDFDPFPWHSFAVWILTQMKRWGQLKGEVDYAKVAREVFLATDAAKLMKEAGFGAPTATTKRFAVMGKEFDPAKPDAYLASFSIKRTV